ncbi:MAG: hypothetical protein B9S32_10575 [Verrucomicrobia bacterium Tous-C9LFEB]|nr:MAG: hypothetical protein B9S32_10575 [Verrucomicrobia bacterium Tous-C9LFEB]
MHAPRKDTFADKLLRMRYFLFAVLLHLIVFFMLSTVVLFKGVAPQEEFESGFIAGGGGGGEPPPPPPPPSETMPVQTQDPNKSKTEVFNIETPAPDAPNIPIPSFTPQLPVANKTIQQPKDLAKSDFQNRAKDIRNMIEGGQKRKIGSGSGKQTAAEFKCYIAQYAQGDWSTTIELKDGKVWRGSIVNLLFMISEWSRNKIRANVVPVPLKLSSSEIFDIKPPFIYFTGHKDFVLTEQEVENLRKYLIQGGAIWGDNGLAGKGSRFDVAFRREMKRVLPSEDQQFVALPDDHPIYTRSFFPMQGPPAGMNFYQEPIEGINMDGTLAIIYTLNDYSDMFRMAFKPGTNDPDTTDAPDKMRITNWEMWKYRTVYYRNFTPEACKTSYELGMNIVVHLLTRWDEKLLLAP